MEQIGGGRAGAGRERIPWWRKRKLLALVLSAAVFGACWYGWTSADPSAAPSAAHAAAHSAAHSAAPSGASNAHEAALVGPDMATPKILERRTATAHGEVVSMAIPGVLSKTHPRPAEIYLPPAWFARQRPHLPVLVVLHGNPGAPTDWAGAVHAPQTLDKWAAAHHGVAPIMVMPDTNNGNHLYDTECVDSQRGNEETYLTRDVPSFVRNRFDTLPPGRAWGVGGFSEGGSCAIMLALRHSGVFRTFLDFGGMSGPRTGESDTDIGPTVAALFHGSRRDFLRHEPSRLLAQHRFPSLGGWFEQGGDDPQPLAAARKLAELSRKSGIDTRLVTVPNAGHTFTLWRAAFGQALSWIMRRVTE